MTEDRRTYAPTPIECFVDFLQTQEELHGLTEYGTEGFCALVRTALPFIPAVVLAGHWIDCTGDSIMLAIGAVKQADRERILTGPAAYLADDPADVQVRDQNAHYLTGLLVGLALANVLREPRGEQ